MGPLVIISCHIGPLGFDLFPWALMAHLLQLCFFHSFPSSSPFTIGLFFLSLGLLSKTGINIQPPEHVNCSYNSYANTSTISFVGFLKSGPHLAYLLQRTNLSFLIYQLFWSSISISFNALPLLMTILSLPFQMFVLIPIFTLYLSQEIFSFTTPSSFSHSSCRFFSHTPIYIT